MRAQCGCTLSPKPELGCFMRTVLGFAMAFGGSGIRAQCLFAWILLNRQALCQPVGMVTGVFSRFLFGRGPYRKNPVDSGPHLGVHGASGNSSKPQKSVRYTCNGV